MFGVTSHRPYRSFSCRCRYRLCQSPCCSVCLSAHGRRDPASWCFSRRQLLVTRCHSLSLGVPYCLFGLESFDDHTECSCHIRWVIAACVSGLRRVVEKELRPIIARSGVKRERVITFLSHTSPKDLLKSKLTRSDVVCSTALRGKDKFQLHDLQLSRRQGRITPPSLDTVGRSFDESSHSVSRSGMLRLPRRDGFLGTCTGGRLHRATHPCGSRRRWPDGLPRA